LSTEQKLENVDPIDVEKSIAAVAALSGEIALDISTETAQKGNMLQMLS
jgi:hypothetical protein